MLKDFFLFFVSSLFNSDVLPTQAKAPSCITSNPQEYFDETIHYEEVGYMRDSLVDMSQKINQGLRLYPQNPFCYKLEVYIVSLMRVGSLVYVAYVCATKISTSTGWSFCGGNTKIPFDSKKGRSKVETIQKMAIEVIMYFESAAVSPERIIYLDDQFNLALVVEQAITRLLKTKQFAESGSLIRKLSDLKLALNPGVRNIDQFVNWILREKLVAVIFYDPFAARSLDFAREVEKLVARMGEVRVPLAKVDVRTMPSLAASYNVRNIPSLLIFEEGEEVQGCRTSSIGNRHEERLAEIFRHMADYMKDQKEIKAEADELYTNTLSNMLGALLPE